MDSWENEAKFVLKERRKDNKVLFRDDDENHTLRKENNKFVRKWGFSYNDMWDLDAEIARFILPRLAYFRAHNDSFPGIFVKETDDEEENRKQSEAAEQKWDRILETICDGLHLYLEKGFQWFNKEEEERWATAKQYLFEYFEYLWF